MTLRFRLIVVLDGVAWLYLGLTAACGWGLFCLVVAGCECLRLLCCAVTGFSVVSWWLCWFVVCVVNSVGFAFVRLVVVCLRV